MRRVSMFASALIATTIGATGCWGGAIVFRPPPPPRATVVVEAPPPRATVVVEAPPPQATVVVEAPPPKPVQVVAVAAPPPPSGRRVFVRIAGVPADYPDYVPFYLNGTVTISAHTAQRGKQGYMLQLVTNDDANAVVAFYKSQMGIMPTAEVNMGPTHILEYADEFHRNKFAVTVSSNGPQTVVMLFAEVDPR